MTKKMLRELRVAYLQHLLWNNRFTTSTLAELEVEWLPHEKPSHARTHLRELANQAIGELEELTFFHDDPEPPELST